MKKVQSSEYYHRNAASFANSGLASKNSGDAGRAITMYEHALNFEMDALNTPLMKRRLKRCWNAIEARSHMR
jgi:Tfp pilus assembly protein PilF